jgi:hypothetical protein
MISLENENFGDTIFVDFFFQPAESDTNTLEDICIDQVILCSDYSNCELIDVLKDDVIESIKKQILKIVKEPGYER